MSETIPADNGGFIKNRVITKNVSAGTFYDPNSEIDNIFTGVPSQYFETPFNLNIDQPLCIDMTFPDPVSLNGFGIVNHNIPTNATVKLKYWSAAGFSEPADDFDTITITPKNTYCFITQTYQYIRLEIDAPGYTIKIGELFPAQTKLQFPHNFSWGYDDEYCVAKEVTTSDAGQHFEEPDVEVGDDPAAAYEKLSMSFGPVDREHFDIFKELVIPGHKIFIPDFTQATCYMGIVPDKAFKAKRNLKGDSYSLRFWEHAIPVE